ncbi:uncharacterized protein LOC132316402 [Cornus florida]|uniref:uncharacterized protein LOC132316402 n=1 Tax=Cornus florida TaxID=4283 RepID=UPI00289AA9F6|nr:uncharacterized protein LOC132316402 [Cornus florida]
MAVNIFYKFPGNCGRLLLNRDDDMIIMFEMNSDVREIDIIVEFVDKGVPINLDSQCPLQNSEGEDEDSEGEDEDSDDSQKSNYSFSNSDDDEDCNEGNEGNEAHDWDNIELESESSDNSYGDLSDYSDSAEFSGESGDERKGFVHQHIKGIVFKYGANGEIKFVKDHLFDNINHFRTVLKEYSVQKGFKLVMKKNERIRVTSHCGNPGCHWRIHATVLEDQVTYKVKTIGPEHTCIRTTKNKVVTSTFIANKLVNKFKNQPDISLKKLEQEVRDHFKVEVSEACLMGARKKALEKNEGTHADSFSKLWKYAAEIQKTNPGSLVFIKHSQEEEPRFIRMFLSFAAVLNGFRDGCRPFIGLDGCFLKGPFGGILISAVGLDGNNG